MYWIIDVALVLVLVAYLVFGYRSGLVKSLGGIVGVIVGGVVAFFAVPLLGGIIPSASWRVVATLAVALALIFTGHAAGSSLGDSISRRFTLAPIRVLDRVLGAIVTTAATALVILLISTSATSLGAPFLAQVLGSSTVIRTIDGFTPDPVQSLLARIRSLAVRDALPRVTEALGGITTSPEIPEISTGSRDLDRAAESVVRISGNALSCGQSQSGSGFVVAQNRVVTNAHVVAGVTEIVVEAPGGQAVAGKVVYFDPIDDLAVIATAGLDADVLELSGNLGLKADAVFDGYPFGGPFSTGPAQVIAVGTERVDDIYGDSANLRDVYTLAADVQQGNSGGPLLSTDGEVAGVIFAKSADTANVGFAMTNTELEPVVADAADLSKRVDTGDCIAG